MIRDLCADPADLLDEQLVQEIGVGTVIRSALELDALGGWLFLTLQEHPMSTVHLIRWVRVQRPRVLPQAIEHAIRELANGGLIEIDGRIWHVRQIAAIGMQLGRGSNERCDEGFTVSTDRRRVETRRRAGRRRSRVAR